MVLRGFRRTLPPPQNIINYISVDAFLALGTIRAVVEACRSSTGRGAGMYAIAPHNAVYHIVVMEAERRCGSDHLLR